jgi:hypothetical protein
MICPRCGQEISDTETICPFCLESVNAGFEFNNYRQDGFVTLQEKKGENNKPVYSAPKYFNVTELNIFVIAIVFVLIVSVMTVFGLKFLQSLSGPDIVETIEITEYVATTQPETTEPVVENEVKSLSIKNIYGSWKNAGDKESDGTAIPYYTFDKDGSATIHNGSTVYNGTFTDLSEDKSHIVNIRIDSYITGTYEFDVKGNKTDGYTLTLTAVNSGTTLKLKSATAKSYTLDTITNAKIDKSLVGKWLSKDKKSSYTFSSSGRVNRVSDNLELKGVWTIYNKNKVTIKYMQSNVETIELNYYVVKNQLVINDGVYYKQ